MLRFERLSGPYGIPVFYQQLPEFVKSTGIALVVFTGAADDTLIGQPGLYHWLEHVPFRGTAKFPNGELAVKGPITMVGGKVGAWTNKVCTNYWATLPTRYIDAGMDVITDMVAQPLLTDESIIAERKVIKQEINDKLSGLESYLAYRVPEVIWNKHPLATPVLGYVESLESMSPELVRKAWEQGYDRSRMVFIISTALPKEDVLDLVYRHGEKLPSRGLTVRRCAASYGALMWKSRLKTELRTGFTSSAVRILFFVPPEPTKSSLARTALLRRIFNYGGTGSPLYRAFRENNQLVYSASIDSYLTRDGGYWGFSLKVSPDNVDAVRVAFLGMLQDPQLRSRKWFDDVKEAGRCGVEMEVIDPDELVDNAVYKVALTGEPLTEEEAVELIEPISHDEILDALDQVNFEHSHIIIASKEQLEK